MPSLRLTLVFFAGKMLVLVGALAALVGFLLTLLGISAAWLAWSGALVSIIAFGTLYLMGRWLKPKWDRTAKEALTTICMPLLNGGTDVWRPVEAMKITNLGYMVTQPEPPEEEWAFQPGHILRCEERQLSDGPKLVAVAKAT